MKEKTSELSITSTLERFKSIQSLGNTINCLGIKSWIDDLEELNSLMLAGKRNKKFRKII